VERRHDHDGARRRDVHAALLDAIAKAHVAQLKADSDVGDDDEESDAASHQGDEPAADGRRGPEIGERRERVDESQKRRRRSERDVQTNGTRIGSRAPLLEQAEAEGNRG